MSAPAASSEIQHPETRKSVRTNSGHPPLSRSADGSTFNHGNELYCICKRPYDPELFMIGCDFCDGWFHADCINVSVQDAKNIESYTCPTCTEKSKKPVTSTTETKRSRGFELKNTSLENKSPDVAPNPPKRKRKTRKSNGTRRRTKVNTTELQQLIKFFVDGDVYRNLPSDSEDDSSVFMSEEEITKIGFVPKEKSISLNLQANVSIDSENFSLENTYSELKKIKQRYESEDLKWSLVEREIENAKTYVKLDSMKLKRASCKEEFVLQLRDRMRENDSEEVVLCNGCYGLFPVRLYVEHAFVCCEESVLHKKRIQHRNEELFDESEEMTCGYPFLVDLDSVCHFSRFDGYSLAGGR